MRDFYKQEGEPDARLLVAAREQYQNVLTLDGKNKQALAGLIAIAMDGKQFGEAREWAERLTVVEPNDKTAWYTMGVLDWVMVFPEYQRARQAAGARQQDYAIPDANLRRTFRDQHLPRVEQGIQMLEKALALDPNYDDAMAYMNLLYRIKSAAVDNQAEAAELMAQADKWVGQALEVKKRKAATPAVESVKLDVDRPPPGPAGRLLTMVKAPPPPPPPVGRARAQQIASALPRPWPEPNQPPMAGQFWQVMGQTDMVAIDLFRQLQSKGFDARMHAGSDNLVRVLVGPYFEDSASDKAKPAIEAAGFRVIRKWE